ncbi:MAG: ATP synthase F1 subunit gamma [Bacteroidetes bacterium]|nr:ATP synthase F1 subunit gamma [Bacteroidota bacterium]
MAGLKEVRTRIASVNSTKQVTSAMKMVSAAKLRKSQDAILKLRPYAGKMAEIMRKASSSVETGGNIFSAQREIKNVLLIPITSNRGLCGGFNANIIRQTVKTARDTWRDKRVSVISIGRKAFAFFRRTEMHIIGTDLAQATRHLGDRFDFAESSNIVLLLMNLFAKKEFDKITLVYNRFKNAATQIVTVEDFLPVQIHSPEQKTGKLDTGYIFEPSQQEIIDNLIPLALKTQFYSALLESRAAEHGARMTAMNKATDNANELLKELRLTYNKARQATITKELLEIVGGAEALKG